MAIHGGALVDRRDGGSCNSIEHAALAYICLAGVAEIPRDRGATAEVVAGTASAART